MRGKVRIAVTCDLHYDPDGRLTPPDKVRAIAKRVRDDAPDVVVIAGDLGHGLSQFRECLSCFRGLGASVGVLAGNHDLWRDPQAGYSSLELWQKHLPKAVEEARAVWLQQPARTKPKATRRPIYCRIRSGLILATLGCLVTSSAQTLVPLIVRTEQILIEKVNLQRRAWAKQAGFRDRSIAGIAGTTSDVGQPVNSHRLSGAPPHAVLNVRAGTASVSIAWGYSRRGLALSGCECQAVCNCKKVILPGMDTDGAGLLTGSSELTCSGNSQCGISMHVRAVEQY